mmetsp:Transcript_53138/g.154641  ORF Transcript_53138/g.154641 Transcript_53138/m.154641 type:complete len:287 (+) Transcript_53138:1542-2402(+)
MEAQNLDSYLDLLLRLRSERGQALTQLSLPRGPRRGTNDGLPSRCAPRHLIPNECVHLRIFKDFNGAIPAILNMRIELHNLLSKLLGRNCASLLQAALPLAGVADRSVHLLQAVLHSSARGEKVECIEGSHRSTSVLEVDCGVKALVPDLCANPPTLLHLEFPPHRPAAGIVRFVRAVSITCPHELLEAIVELDVLIVRLVLLLPLLQPLQHLPHELVRTLQPLNILRIVQIAFLRAPLRVHIEVRRLCRGVWLGTPLRALHREVLAHGATSSARDHGFPRHVRKS